MGESKGCIRDLNLGQTLSVLPETPLAKQNITNGDKFWTSKIVPGLDFGERYNRRKILSKRANELGYVVRWDEKQLHFLEKNYNRWEKQGRPVT